LPDPTADNAVKDQECKGSVKGSGRSKCEGVGWPRGNDECLDVHECRSTPISLI